MHIKCEEGWGLKCGDAGRRGITLMADRHRLLAAGSRETAGKRATGNRGSALLPGCITACGHVPPAAPPAAAAVNATHLANGLRVVVRTK